MPYKSGLYMLTVETLDDSIGICGLSVSTIIILLQDLGAEELSENFERIHEV